LIVDWQVRISFALRRISHFALKDTFLFCSDSNRILLQLVVIITLLTMEADSNNNNIIDIETTTTADPCFDADDPCFDASIDQEIIIDSTAACHDTSNTSTITDPTPSFNVEESSEAISTKFKLRSDVPLSKNTRTNPVWKYFQHFDILFHPDKRHHRCCLICRQSGEDKAIAVGPKASPGPLINHLRRHQEQYQEYMVAKDELESKAVSTSKTQLTISSFAPSLSFSQDVFKKNFARWVVEQNMPLTVGEAPAFIAMIKAANKSLSIPDYKTTYDLLFGKKTEATRKLKCYLESRYFSITCDHWTSMAQENYGALTLHLIDNFELKTFVLSCKKHPNGASAPEVESQLTSDLITWGLEKSFFSVLLLTQRRT
jgi:hypothetical protein